MGLGPPPSLRYDVSHRGKLGDPSSTRQQACGHVSPGTLPHGADASQPAVRGGLVKNEVRSVSKLNTQTVSTGDGKQHGIPSLHVHACTMSTTCKRIHTRFVHSMYFICLCISHVSGMCARPLGSIRWVLACGTVANEAVAARGDTPATRALDLSHSIR